MQSGTMTSLSTVLASLVLLACFVFRCHSDGDQSCDEHEYACANGRCISRSLVNNSVNDCEDNSDEVANPCRKPLFSCRNDRCILSSWVLDGNNDCIDGSDEVKRVGISCEKVTNCCRCEDYVAHSECDAAKFCRCSKGYYSNELGTICHQRVIGSVCNMSRDCLENVGNSSCISNRCECNGGYYAANHSTQCERRLLGNECNSSYDCQTILHSHCRLNSTCSCDVGYQTSDDMTSCLPVLINDTCHTNADCLAVRSVCRASKCACPIGYYGKSARDVCVRRLLGDGCVTNDDCATVIDFAVCKLGHCACPDDRLATTSHGQSQTCLPDNSSRDIAIVAMAIVILSCLFIFDCYLIFWMLRNFVFRNVI